MTVIFGEDLREEDRFEPVAWAYCMPFVKICEPDLLFGNALDGSIHGYKFHDLNGNATWDPGEPGLGGVVITLSGMILRMGMKGISVYGRATQGVRLMTLGEDDDRIVSVAPVPMEERSPDSGAAPPESDPGNGAGGNGSGGEPEAAEDTPDEPEDPPIDL